MQSSAEIAEQALRQISKYSPYDTGADAASFEIALERLGMLLNYLVGTKDLWFFVPDAVSITLTANTSEYSLDALISPERLQFITRAFLYYNGTLVNEIELARRDRRQEFAGRTASEPEAVIIERKTTNPKLIVLPAPHTSGYTLKLEGQKYSEDVTTEQGEVPHGFPEAWELFLVYRLAADIGFGPVVTLVKSDRDDLLRIAGSMAEALGRNMRSNIRGARYTRFRDL